MALTSGYGRLICEPKINTSCLQSRLSVISSTVTRRDANPGSSLVLFVSQVSPLTQHIHTGLLFFLHIKPWSYPGVSHMLFSLAGMLCSPPHSVHPQVPSCLSDLRSDVCHLLRMPSLLYPLWSLLYSIMLFCDPKTYRFSLSYICLPVFYH